MTGVGMDWSLGELGRMFGGEIAGDPDRRFRLVSIDTVDPDGIALCENQGYLARSGGVGALLLPMHLSGDDRPHIRVPDPRRAFRRLLAESERPLPLRAGIHPTAVVDDAADVHPSASIGAYAVVEAGAVIGPEVRVFPFCYVGDGCRIGEQSVVYPHAVLLRNVLVGVRCRIHPGAVLGAEGFGFERDDAGWHRVPHVGFVRLGDDVEVRALASVERATCGTTEIGDGSKIGNLVQVGHNAQVGSHTVLAPMSGVGGSSTLAPGTVLGGQAGVGDHVEVSSGVQLAAASCTTRDIRRAGVYAGSPARPLAQQHRLDATAPYLPAILDRLRRLENDREAE
ncbi:UDP-3-O-(3-hydroxymyristoyl)glucosamine N-acyltransferase [Micromonospora sp. C95]|uniref:UDP-3-O-(3-hydroxymyristoyl)glucosamine N-acyltransferase n=1 Tax=Micromonospora sp. C95 TaxID=2824882 RepID=UPI001B38EBDD|nr:UDP-3-O-(3-hydroxymyristoyl)glucosamine N-acyltransferase [Micromonospora sp. C95]MBQ1027542.1 UDP-3-O-(3-hydroxymyristoyl)glucosamine N-acyltransferase [Micromonospora sp. C95]